MSLSLPANLEAFADDYTQMTSPGVYALGLTRPPDPASTWDDVFDARPRWFHDFATAERVVYVGASTNVLGRLEDHRDGTHQPTLVQVCEIDGIVDVWWTAEPFQRESAIAIELGNDHPEWFVRQA